MPASYPKEPVTLGEHIRKKRMDLNLNQIDVARYMDIEEETIGNWERNLTVPQIKYYPKIIDFLGYSPLNFDETKLSGRLQSYRWRNGFSNKVFAKLIGVDGSTILAWESEKSMPQEKQMRKLELFFSNIEPHAKF